MLISLNECSSVPVGDIGKKAFNLGLMKMLGLNVPEGYVLPSAYLRKLLQDNNKLEDFNKLVYSDAVLNRFTKLRTMITNLEFNDSDRKVLLEAFAVLGGCVAVRSSAPSEDGEVSSKAGLYSSYINITDGETFLKSILECFASAFTQGLYLSCSSFGEGTAVVIQKYMLFDVSGVAFSCNPVNSDRDYISINMDKGGLDKIVSGKTDSDNLLIKKRGTVESLYDGLPMDVFQELTEKLCYLENYFNHAVDTEWGIWDNRVYFVQVRPVSGLGKDRKNTNCVVDLDNLKQCAEADLGCLYDIHLRWLNKKFYVRNICKRLGYRTPQMRYLILPGDEIAVKNGVNNVLNSFTTEYVEIYDGKDFTIALTEDLLEICKKISAEYTVPIRVRVQEFQMNTVCGYATIMPGGSILVETLPGMFKGFWIEGLSPSIYYLDMSGNIISSEINSVDKYYSFDPEKKISRLYEFENQITCTVPQDALAEITRLCIDLYSEFGEVRVEWVYDGSKVELFDLSEESKPMLEVGGTGRVISTGYGEGPVCKIEDINIFDHLFGDVVDDIDVIPKQSFLEFLHSDRCREIIRQTLCGYKRPIVMAEFPKRTLAILTDYVSGFVFERGSVLCHLSIILREKGIPALIMPGASKTFSNGDQAKLADGYVLKWSQI